MYRYSLVFLFSFAIFLSFQTPNINTGDAGELITASYYLGTAHPSGYPLYLLIGKTLTFLPFGNMAFKVAFVSAVFSSLALTLMYWMVFRLTSSDVAAIFTVVLLLTSFSYFTQSVIAKFYPLNLFLILSVFSIWLFQIRSPGLINNLRACYLTSFLFGLITANHHTGILIFVPVMFALFLCRRGLAPSLEKIWVMVLTIGALFLSGFMINGYLLVRGGDGHFVNVFYVRDLEEFFRLISRQTYGESGTISVAGYLFHNPASFWYGFKNLISILDVNFSLFSCPLFFSGCFYLLRKDYKIFAFTTITLFVYGPLFAKLSLPSPEISQMDYYIVAHQYFLPALAIYALFVGIGFFQITAWLGISKSKLVSKILAIIMVIR